MGRKDMETAVSLMGDKELEKVGQEVVGEILRRTLAGRPTEQQKQVLDAILAETKRRAKETE